MLPHWDGSCRSNTVNHPVTKTDTGPKTPNIFCSQGRCLNHKASETVTEKQYQCVQLELLQHHIIFNPDQLKSVWEEQVLLSADRDHLPRSSSLKVVIICNKSMVPISRAGMKKLVRRFAHNVQKVYPWCKLLKFLPHRTDRHTASQPAKKLHRSIWYSYGSTTTVTKNKLIVSLYSTILLPFLIFFWFILNVAIWTYSIAVWTNFICIPFD